MSVRDIVMSAAGQGGENLYVEDVFQTWLRTGTGADVTVTNNVDMTEGYMLWTKGRSGATDHAVYDSERGVTKDLVTNSTAAETTQSTGLKAVSSTGYTIGSLAKMNTSGATYADWVFRKAPKFFDVVTYTGTGDTNVQNISHNLGSVPGMIIVKETSASRNWATYHRASNATPQNYTLYLNTTNAAFLQLSNWNNTAPTDSNFTVGGAAGSDTNQLGASYVAYLFAHDAGGFGDTGTDSVVACGSFTTDGSGNATVNLGWEPQYVLVKTTNFAWNWLLYDSMRGMPVSTSNDKRVLLPDSSAAESNLVGAYPTATGFEIKSLLGAYNFIYLAIRRPMKTPESGTEVFQPVLGNNVTVAGQLVATANFPVDAFIGNKARSATASLNVMDRLRGDFRLFTDQTSAEASITSLGFDNNEGITYDAGTANFSSVIYWLFRRAPGFFDVVCYTGTGASNRQVGHNLAATPQLIIVKTRSATDSWYVLFQPDMRVALLNSTNDYFNASFTKFWFGDGTNEVSPTSSVFTLGSDNGVNQSGTTYVAYLFASVPGVSKVGSYTGTGTTQDINCGFTTGARFVMIKRTDSTGNWYVWDTARGIVSSNDPYLLLNSTAAEVTSTDYIDPLASGFQISSTAPAAINASGGSFIYYAVA